MVLLPKLCCEVQSQYSRDFSVGGPLGRVDDYTALPIIKCQPKYGRPQRSFISTCRCWLCFYTGELRWLIRDRWGPLCPEFSTHVQIMQPVPIHWCVIGAHPYVVVRLCSSKGYSPYRYDETPYPSNLPWMHKMYISHRRAATSSAITFTGVAQVRHLSAIWRIVVL